MAWHFLHFTVGHLGHDLCTTHSWFHVIYEPEVNLLYGTQSHKTLWICACAKCRNPESMCMLTTLFLPEMFCRNATETKSGYLLLK